MAAKFFSLSVTLSRTLKCFRGVKFLDALRLEPSYFLAWRECVWWLVTKPCVNIKCATHVRSMEGRRWLLITRWMGVVITYICVGKGLYASANLIK
ncbi:hypothetical protein B9Q06_05245 [Candidatus Marsarchaeota G2 archaeon ECH_B_2]|uniref:Uncharacterized protein n=2 Tax=Candidatus Marsarchaeota group 2 TaxID=2203771 RepID=A0A2R6BAV9_9ARCH|nr:MAG: hypothetical protein B9Q06_05245 [Candidatus Marsarchaeota G2 archaeon ECH_B_2]PSO00064.1 MAG: hypothetical protein B9Q07_04955 [Candidatus Marsarchaeota G2 archaeon ECH_B_3]